MISRFCRTGCRILGVRVGAVPQAAVVGDDELREPRLRGLGRGEEPEQRTVRLQHPHQVAGHDVGPTPCRESRTGPSTGCRPRSPGPAGNRVSRNDGSSAWRCSRWNRSRSANTSSTKILQPSCSPKIRDVRADDGTEVEQRGRRTQLERGDELLQRLRRHDDIGLGQGRRRRRLLRRAPRGEAGQEARHLPSSGQGSSSRGTGGAGASRTGARRQQLTENGGRRATPWLALQPPASRPGPARPCRPSRPSAACPRCPGSALPRRSPRGVR